MDVHTVLSLRLLTIQEADGTTETIRTTDEHPFWVSDLGGGTGGWVKAADLQVGQQFLTTSGQLATLTATDSESHPEGITVYNLTVDGDHTYFVTDVADDEAVWAHNEGMPFEGWPMPAPPWEPTTQPGTVGGPTEGNNAFVRAVLEYDRLEQDRERVQQETDLRLLQGLANTAQAGVNFVGSILGFVWDMTLGNPGYCMPRPPAVLAQEQAEAQRRREKLDFAKDLIVHQSDEEYNLNLAIGEAGWSLVSLKLPFKSPQPRVGPTIEAAKASEIVVIGKIKDLNNLQAGEKTLLDQLPNLRSPKANWYQNASVLRQAMAKMKPIRDASVDAMGNLIDNTGFLKAERNLLRNKGWVYDQMTRMWWPPSVIAVP